MKKRFFYKAVIALWAAALCAGCADRNTAAVNEEIVSRLDAIEQKLYELTENETKDNSTEDRLMTYKGYVAGDLIAPEDLNYTLETREDFLFIEIMNEEKEYMPGINITGILYKDNEIVGCFEASSMLTAAGMAAMAKARLPEDAYGNVAEYDSYELQFVLGREMKLEDVDTKQIEVVAVPCGKILKVLVKNNGDVHVDSVVVQVRFFLNGEFCDFSNMYSYDIPAGGVDYAGETGYYDQYFNRLPVGAYTAEVISAQNYIKGEGVHYE